MKMWKKIFLIATVLFLVVALIFAFMKLQDSAMYKKMKGWLDKLDDDEDDKKRYN